MNETPSRGNRSCWSPLRFAIFLIVEKGQVYLQFPSCYQLIQCWTEVWTFSRDIYFCEEEFYLFEDAIMLPLLIIMIAAIYCSLRGFSQEVMAADDTRHASTVDSDRPTRTLTLTPERYGVTCAWMQRRKRGLVWRSQ